MAVSESFRGVRAERVFSPPVPTRAKAHARVAVRARPAAYADIPPVVFKVFVGCWALLMAVFFATFAESAFTLFMLAVCTGYAIMFFGVPYLMSRVAPPENRLSDVSMADFLRGKVQTLYGPVNGGEALLQVIMVPLALALGGIAIGFIVHLEADHIHMLYLGRTGAFPQ
jgi:hypothetical protein